MKQKGQPGIIPLILLKLIVLCACQPQPQNIAPEPIKFTFENKDKTKEPYPKVLVPGLEVYLIAGNGKKSYMDGPAFEASFNTPSDLSVIKDEDVLISDLGNNRIRRYKNGTVSTVAGNGKPEVKIGNSLDSSFYSPQKLLVTNTSKKLIVLIKDSQGVIYELNLETGKVKLFSIPKSLLEYYHSKSIYFNEDAVILESRPTCLAEKENKTYVCLFDSIFEITEGMKATRHIGDPRSPGQGSDDPKSHYLDGNEDKALFNRPASITFGQNNDMYISDTGNHSLRKYDGINKKVSTVTGHPRQEFSELSSGFKDGPNSDAELSSPGKIIYIHPETILIIDNNSLRLVTSRSVSTLILSKSLSSIAYSNNRKLYASDLNGYIYRIDINLENVLDFIAKNPNTLPERF